MKTIREYFRKMNVNLSINKLKSNNLNFKLWKHDNDNYRSG